jgi:hypothetical protein
MPPGVGHVAGGVPSPLWCLLDVTLAAHDGLARTRLARLISPLLSESCQFTAGSFEADKEQHLLNHKNGAGRSALAAQSASLPYHSD